MDSVTGAEAMILYNDEISHATEVDSEKFYLTARKQAVVLG